MSCPRLEHFVRLNIDGTVGRCGHMTSIKGFSSYKKLDNSQDYITRTIRYIQVGIKAAQ